jgi:serine protease inhibitor
LNLNQQFTRTLENRLKSTIKKLDFKSNTKTASSTVNSWISQITEGYIKDIIPPGTSLNQGTSFLLVNALFYSGQWRKPFTLLPEKQIFKVDSKNSIKVPAMSTESTFGYGYIPELKSTGISMPFKDERFEFIIIKPDDGQTVETVRPLLISYPLEQISRDLNENKRTGMNFVAKIVSYLSR